MAITFDAANKLLILSSGTTTLDVKDAYSRWKDWVQLSDNSKYVNAFVTAGGETIDAGAGTFIPLYAFLANGWRVRPQEASHTLAVTNGILLVDGGGDPFVNTTGSYVVRVNYQQPVQAITVSTGGGGGGLTTEQATQLAELHKIHGLLSGVPLQVSAAARVAGDVTQNIVEALGTVTVQRA